MLYEVITSIAVDTAKADAAEHAIRSEFERRITSYNVCYTKLLRQLMPEQ